MPMDIFAGAFDGDTSLVSSSEEALGIGQDGSSEDSSMMGSIGKAALKGIKAYTSKEKAAPQVPISMGQTQSKNTVPMAGQKNPTMSASPQDFEREWSRRLALFSGLEQNASAGTKK